MSNQKEEFASVFLNNLVDLKPIHFQSLIQNFKSATLALEAGVKSWTTVDGFDSGLVERLQLGWDEAMKSAEEESDFLRKQKVKTLLLQSADYPQLLRQISAPPPIIYVK